MRWSPLLLLAGCAQPMLEGVTPDELHVWGSQGWGDGDISTQGRDYRTSADGYRVGLGLTWSLGPPATDLRPELERIARAVERPETPSAPFFVVPPSSDAREPERSPEPVREEESHWQATGKAVGGLVTFAGLIWAAVRQGRKASTPEPYPVDESAAD